MIKICNDRSVFPNSVKVSNQCENGTRSIDFDLSEVQFKGNVYLICKYQGQSTFYAPLLLDENNSIPVETFLSAQPGAYTCVIVISRVTIDADYNFSSDNPLFVSNEFTLNVDPNFLTGTATAWELTPAAQNYFDQLIVLVDKVREDLDSGAFIGNGIKSITLISTVGLVDTYQILFTNGSTFDFQVTNGATPTITIQDGVWFVNGISTGVSALGQKGDKGDPGVGIVSIEKTSVSGNVDTYTITFTNQTTSTFTVTNGTNGKDGVTPNIQIGTVTTLPAGSQATASITGTTENPLLNLGIPEGEQGSGGTTNYNELENKPQINGVELSGNKSGNDVGLVNVQQGIENSGKVLGIDQDGLVVPVENAGASDNIIYKDVPKQLNPNITDGFLRAMWNLKMYGQSTQENTTGSQLWVNPEPRTLNGVTLTIENGWAILNGTCTANGNISIGQQKLEAGEYTINVEIEGSYPPDATVVSQVYSANGGILTITTGNISPNLPVTRELNSANNYEFRIFIKKDFVYNNYKVRTMLNKGSEALPWEPYTGGQPSPSPQYPQEITSIEKFGGAPTGGNLFDFTKVKQSENMIVDYENKTITIMANTNNAGYVNNLKDLMGGYKIGEKYVMSAKTSNIEAQRIIYFLNVKSSIRFDEPFVLTEEILNSPFAWYNNIESKNQNVISNIQIELGETATPYTPYQAQPFTYTPTQNMYSTQDGSIADYVGVEKGVEVYQLKKVIFDGTNATFIRLNENNVYYTSLLNDAITPYELAYEYYIWCDKLKTYTPKTSIDSLDNSIRYGNGGGTSKLLFLKIDDTITTVEQLNTWLQSNPVTVVYVVQTPTEIPIDPEQLSMLRSLYTYTGVTNFLCNAPVSFTYERSLQIVINNLENAVNTNALNIAVKE